MKPILTSTRRRLLASTVLPMAVALTLGAAGPAAADHHGGGCGAEYKPHACNPCGANICHPDAMKAGCNPCNPCAANYKPHACNPCGANICHPDAMKAGCNPCNPCAADYKPHAGNPCGPDYVHPDER